MMMVRSLQRQKKLSHYHQMQERLRNIRHQHHCHWELCEDRIWWRTRRVC